MTSKERVLRRLKGMDVDMTPVGCTTAYAVVELMKSCRCERPAADFDPEAMAGLSVAGHTIAGFDWVKAMGWDITSVSQVLGCTLGEPAIDLPLCVKGHPYREQITGLDCPSHFTELGRFPAFAEQFRIIKERLGGRVAIFGMSEGPFTAGANLVGTDKMMRATIRDPKLVTSVLEVTTEAVARAVRFAFEHGADYYCIAEPTSGTELLSPSKWATFVGPALKQVAERSDGPIVLHICGNADRILPHMCDAGVAGISIEEKTSLPEALRIAHEKGVTVFGNISASSTLFMGTPEDCNREAMQALAAGVDFLCPGCGVAPRSPLQNVQQLREARDSWFSGKPVQGDE
jgi:[methyl-Co(III) methanol-specific corrinoid protein]:coenzyme M methyltransferase